MTAKEFVTRLFDRWEHGDGQSFFNALAEYGRGRWRKLKGFATVRLADGTIHTAEIHWYEAHGIGQKEFKIKFPLLD